MDQTELSVLSLTRVLQGAAVATKAPGTYIQTVRDALRFDVIQHFRPAELGSSADSEAFPETKLTFDEWRFFFASRSQCNLPGVLQLTQLVLAVSLLREKARRELQVDSRALDLIWSLIHDAVVGAEGTELQFTVSRSAQGFLAMPVCSLLEKGRIQELWRFHVWLPDGERGMNEVRVHSHPSFAQSWILLGSATDCTYNVDTPDDTSLTTHATYELSFASADGKQSGSEYQTHQSSSTIRNAGKLVRVTPCEELSHTRDMTYTIPGGCYHYSLVPRQRLHATLFVFDSHRGYDETAGVLGPKNGNEYTQIRDPAGITSLALVRMAEAARKWEQECGYMNTGEVESPVIQAYYMLFRGLGLHQAGHRDEALQFLSPTFGVSSLQVFTHNPSNRHNEYTRQLRLALSSLDPSNDNNRPSPTGPYSDNDRISDAVAEFHRLIARADEHHEQALWQEKLRVLQEASAICDVPKLPDAGLKKTRVLVDIAGVFRRMGHYDRAEITLNDALELQQGGNPLQQASIHGELGIVARHSNHFQQALQHFHAQSHWARAALPNLQAELEICRAVGNEGITALNLWQVTHPKDPTLLDTATALIRERIATAKDLQDRVGTEDPKSAWYLGRAYSWEVIGMNRLTLCLIAAGNTQEAVQVAQKIQLLQSRTPKDPTILAITLFFYGNALWSDNQREQALRIWSTPQGTCSPAAALCKELSGEYVEYLGILSSAGVDFDTYDEQGFTPLDHAVLSNSTDAPAAMKIIEAALGRSLNRDHQRDNPDATQESAQISVDHGIALRKHQAQLRRQYRTILQERIRPELRSSGSHSFSALRRLYADFLSKDNQSTSMFSKFSCVNFVDFRNHGKLPSSDSGLAKEFQPVNDAAASTDDQFIVFISYRWIGGNVPDLDNQQWSSMIAAIDAFLKANPDIREENLSIWLDYACIDQVNDERKQQGIDALPLAVTQCNAMISLVDETYYERAWCAVEVMLMRALVRSYGIHQLWEFADGSLEKSDLDREPKTGELKLTNEQADRPRVDFLLRQSKLLGRDDA